jgi:hypothetical protein
MVHCDRTALIGLGLNAQLPQQLLKIGFADRDFEGRLPLGTSLHGTLIKCLEEAHLGDGVFLRTGEGPAVFGGPVLQRGLMNKDFEGEGGLAVNRNEVSELAAGTGAALGAIALKKVILIHKTVSGRVAFDAANGIRASHGRIIGGRTREVNAVAHKSGGAEMKQTPGVQVPNQNESCFKKPVRHLVSDRWLAQLNSIQKRQSICFK